ncbi:type I-E CRISPR-associated endonuclease Cas1e [Natronoglycomyces albus]|uniref:CRISPR-associated endonuclease Cas1 n=1 Tax=Natronoglycomyces albus TaxID=2811108 RepID=A0A895XWC9_9ACTN|nr:type I-E CRISPR-associated endonuclease Cas1e [Natronoglycomyces albus]QSB06530.1 type I-E CRISPR-associated endonuclease Cas1 [Natronoglycomyces albus]
MSDPRKNLGAPVLAMLPRVADSLSFLYLETARIVQDDTGICAQVERAGKIDRVYLPVAALSCLLLGPGTSITQPAIATIARHNTTVVWTGAGGVRMYAAGISSALTAAWLEKQARAWASDDTRLAVAQRMFGLRFDDTIEPANSLAQLRGLEGARMKALYRSLADRHGIRGFRRNYDPHNWETQSPVNQALSAANTALYGVCHAAILALGCSPALGFVHSGKQHAFVYDIADLYKAKHTIPLAFTLHRASNPEAEARRRFRKDFTALRLLPTIVRDIQRLIDPDTSSTEPVTNPELVHLWDPDLGDVAAGINHAELDPDW